MKKALLAATILGLCAAASAQEARTAPASAAASDRYEDASWTASVRKSDPSKLDLNISDHARDARGHHESVYGQSIPLDDFTGLNRADLESGQPVTFELRREAGTIVFTGRFAEGVGQGRFRLVPNPAYEARVRQLGIAGDPGSRDSQLGLVLLDVTTAYIGALKDAGFTAPLHEYVSMRAVGVTPALAREIKPIVTGGVTGQQLVSLAAVGVTPDYARALRGIFPELRAEQLVSLKALKASPAQLARFRTLGLAFSANDATSMTALGVTPDYVEAIRAAGGRIEDGEDAVRFRSLGISPDAVRKAVARGIASPTASDVMRVAFRP